MSTFTPPNTNSYAVSGPGCSPLARRLLRFYGSEPQGENVYYLTSGAITTTDPDGMTVTWDMVAHVWWGGHAGETVTAAQATALTLAGYTLT